MDHCITNESAYGVSFLFIFLNPDFTDENMRVKTGWLKVDITPRFHYQCQPHIICSDILIKIVPPHFLVSDPPILIPFVYPSPPSPVLSPLSNPNPSHHCPLPTSPYPSTQTCQPEPTHHMYHTCVWVRTPMVCQSHLSRTGHYNLSRYYHSCITKYDLLTK